MEYNIAQSLLILERTPLILEQMLHGLPNEWILSNEGKDTFSPFDVVGHLIHGEKTDWIDRLEIILSDKPEKTFMPYDRFAQFKDSIGKSMEELLSEFKQLRQRNLKILRSKNLTANDFTKTGNHPALGTVTLKNLLATWTVHDLSHIAQISRVMAKQYKGEVGPWTEYLPILTR